MTKPKTWQEALATLAKPVPQTFIKTKPGRGGAEYVPHHIIRQYLHGVFDDHNFETLEVVPKGDGAYALKVRLTVRLGDETRSYDGWGESDNRQYPLKSAESDAVKRIAAMHLGLGLHLWSREHYFLPDALAAELDGAAGKAAAREATYGGDGDEVSSPAEPPAAREDGASEAVPPSDAPTSSPAAGDGEAPAAGEPRLDKAQRAKLRAGFMACVSNLGLSYENDVKPYLIGKHGGSWSELSDEKVRSITGALFGGKSRADKEQMQQRFAQAVRDFNAGA